MIFSYIYHAFMRFAFEYLLWIKMMHADLLISLPVLFIFPSMLINFLSVKTSLIPNHKRNDNQPK